MASEKLVRLEDLKPVPDPEESETDGLVKELRRRIVLHELPPGARLREHELAKEYKVSRARVREAFGVLEERGLIERIPNKGAMVTRLEADAIQELFEVREFLEAAMVRLATQRAAPATWDRLLEVFGDNLGEAVANNDFDAYLAAILDFRGTCIIAAENETLKGLLDSIYDRIQGMTRRLVLVPGRAKAGFHQHREILRAMREGDADRAQTEAADLVSYLLMTLATVDGGGMTLAERGTECE
jgi:DNA-binding GntR family transcriptional regulator